MEFDALTWAIVLLYIVYETQRKGCSEVCDMVFSDMRCRIFHVKIVRGNWIRIRRGSIFCVCVCVCVCVWGGGGGLGVCRCMDTGI